MLIKTQTNIPLHSQRSIKWWENTQTNPASLSDVAKASLRGIDRGSRWGTWDSP